MSLDRTHGDTNAKARAIVDDAIAELLMLGMVSRSSAAAMMAIQAMCRIEDDEEQRTVADFANSLI